MCSFLVQIVYGVCMVVTLILTIVSIALNAWSTAGEAGNSIGLFCPDLDAALVDAAAGKNVCKISFDVFDTLPGKVKAIFACLILAIIMEVVCLAYNLFTAFACCCKSILLYVLLAFTLFTVVMLGIVDAANAMGTGNAGALKDQVGPGKSFFMVVVALVTAIIDTVVCGIAIFCAKKAI
ncbi:hypothetical protein PRIPAC_86519 [Pristionchus pacificus]|uniref:Uncharacterized protein n=1 Tax=Pristionchus pacificus TaxID=54126 RepID=A0A2A6BTL8_PRIPA|nr:hypothetical protein PRIPAC_86519 [Pristionchus pacificus]|eukprot:PDM69235.1 hypothetical protein PRIPAC_47537 [Pristionchus pacificus]